MGPKDTILFEKNNVLLNNIVSFGPLWAHMGPNPDRAPTWTGPEPGLGPNPDWVDMKFGSGFALRSFCSDNGFIVYLWCRNDFIHAHNSYDSRPKGAVEIHSTPKLIKNM